MVGLCIDGHNFGGDRSWQRGTICGATDGPKGTVCGAMDGPEGLSVAAVHVPGDQFFGDHP